MRNGTSSRHYLRREIPSSYLVKFLPIHLIIDQFTAPIKEEGDEEQKQKDENKDKIKEKENEENNLSNGAEKNILKKEDNWDSERHLNEVVYKKEN